jgi:hypothetical protein
MLSAGYKVEKTPHIQIGSLRAMVNHRLYSLLYMASA